LSCHYERLVVELVSIAEGWLTRYSRCPSWKAVINSPHRLVHELEDAVVPLQEVVDTCFGGSWSSESHDKDGLTSGDAGSPPICIVDLCAGKAFIALALLELAACWPNIRKKLGALAIVEKRCPSYEHVFEIATRIQLPLIVLPDNIHDEAFPGRLLSKLPPCLLGFVAVHLCGRLSSRAVELFNLLGNCCQFLFLAPCCMPSGVPPRKGQTRVAVRQTEATANELRVLTAQELKKARWTEDRHLCWNCGEPGHAKNDCPQPMQGMAKYKANRTKHSQKVCEINLLDIGSSHDPFSAWVGSLAKAVEPLSHVQQVRILLGDAEEEMKEKDEVQECKPCRPEQKDWHAGRKGAWIFAKRSLAVIPSAHLMTFEQDGDAQVAAQQADDFAHLISTEKEEHTKQ